MGNKNVKQIESAEEGNKFKQHLIKDIKALSLMLENGMFESGVQRIGAEQELNFVDESWRPSLIAPEILDRLTDEVFTSEYCKFNFEINLPPLAFSGNCLSEMKRLISTSLNEVTKEAAKFNSDIILVGILPTVLKSDATIDSITPEPRYRALFNLLQKYRGKAYEYHIKGIDDLIIRDNLAVFGGCMTSFQLHFQISPEDSVEKFNWAQMISGPVLAMATNSPLFLGKRLWHETRIALFQQATDTRKPYNNYKEREARVSIGSDWVRNSILEFFQDEVVNYKVMLATEITEDPIEMVNKGKAPKLQALNFHNGTIYKWNRPCYGISNNGKPHLRIENRILPAGPTMEDQVANAAFWLGLMNGQPEKYKNLPDKMLFSDAKDNFLKAARLGLEVKFNWLDGKLISAQKLITDELLPLAEEGLRKANVDENDIRHNLDIIYKRVNKGITGSKWMISSFNNLVKEGTAYEALVAITSGIVKRQKEGKPVHEWEDATIEEAGTSKNRFSKIEQVMTTTIYALEEDDPVDLAAHVMEWKNISHIPVENKQGNLIGLVTKDSMVKYLINKSQYSESPFIKEIMVENPITIEPETDVNTAVSIILEKNITCLPVVKRNKIVGIVTEHDFVKISKHLFEEFLKFKK
jgi:CBS domain-containing protein